MMIRREQQIHRRHHEQREQGADRQARGDDDAHLEARHRAGAGRGDQRDDAEHHGGGRHQDRAQPDAGGFLDRLALGAALFLQVVGELHDQNAVLADQAHQRHQADLGVDVERHAAEAERDEDQRAGDRHRHRNQNDHRIAEALEQGGERQEDDDQREAERGDEAATSPGHIAGSSRRNRPYSLRAACAPRGPARTCSASPCATPGMATPTIWALLSC